MRNHLVIIALVAVGGGAHAEPAAPSRPPSGLAFGVELGTPSSATARFAFADGHHAVTAAAGTGTLGGAGFSARLELSRAVGGLAHVGVGVRHRRHHYAPASMDELPDAHTGLLASASVARAFGPLELYAELAPGYDVLRTPSCSLASGASSVCPHAQSTHLFLEAFAGARWYLEAP